jgi:hypothetical protein
MPWWSHCCVRVAHVQLPVSSRWEPWAMSSGMTHPQLHGCGGRGVTHRRQSSSSGTIIRGPSGSKWSLHAASGPVACRCGMQERSTTTTRLRSQPFGEHSSHSQTCSGRHRLKTEPHTSDVCVDPLETNETPIAPATAGTATTRPRVLCAVCCVLVGAVRAGTTPSIYATFQVWRVDQKQGACRRV